MSEGYPEILNQLIKGLTMFPGVGPKSAERIALHLLKESEADVRELARLMVDSKEKIFFCELCHSLTTEKLCGICQDPSRDQTQLCVVESPRDVSLIEKTGCYRGLYHVLFGVLSPIDGVGPAELRLDFLVRRVRSGNIREVILATNPNTEGDTTALYLSEAFGGADFKVTRIARGVPIGSHLEYVDQATLERAMLGRTEFA